MEKRPFAELGLSPEVLKAVDLLGYEEASPIQTAVIPAILAGRDVVGQSATGSGKTAAFAIPAIELAKANVAQVQSLILCPTRELAVQVAEETDKLLRFKRGLSVVPIYGGQSYDRQFRALAAGVQIVIGTPGRVIDHIERGTLKLDGLRLIVLDEADRMLDMGFREDIERILSALPAQRQALFFSATMPRAIQDLIGRYSRDPAWIRIESQAQNAPQVDQVYFEVDRRSKIEVLTRLIDLHDFRYGLIFCSTKVMVDELDEHLHARGYATDRLHGDLSQMQRNRVMEKFHRRAFEFLVATDVAARGLDVDDLEVVFNFDLPNDAEDYTHRIGRTGRAGKTGRAYTFVSGREIYKLQAMVRFAKLKIRRENVPSLDQVDEARANVFFEKLRSVLEAGKFQSHDRMVDRLLEQGYASTDICSALIELLKGGGAGGESGGAVASPPAGSPAAAKTSSAHPSGGARSAGPGAPRSSAGPKPVGRRPEADPAPGPAASGETAEGAASPDGPVVRRTGKEAGMTTLFFNVGRKQLVTQAEIVGKIAGVTRLPAQVIGAIDLHQRHALVDVATEHAPLVLTKLNGVRVRGHSLKVALATTADAQLE
jgi:ATP-dependent RNA helicase DeaD